MANGRGDLMGTLSNIFSNIDMNQVMSLVSGFMNQRQGNNNGKSSGNLGSVLGNLDLGKLSEVITGMNPGGQNSTGNSPSFFDSLGNLGNFANLGNFLGNNKGNNGIFQIGDMQSIFSSFTDHLQSLRRLRF